MTDKEAQTQIIALVLIFGAAVAIGLGSHFGWHDLVSFGLTFGGTGTGILTGQRLNKNHDGEVTANPLE
ncbi:MAG: hypothetical protein ACP5E5_07800 [Acidobacteriaceae bacterium]